MPLPFFFKKTDAHSQTLKRIYKYRAYFVKNIKSYLYIKHFQSLIRGLGLVGFVVLLTSLSQGPQLSPQKAEFSSHLTVDKQRIPAAEIQKSVRKFDTDSEPVYTDWLANAPGDNYISVLKFVFVLNAEGKIDTEPYFLNPSAYGFHWQFVNDLNSPKTNLSFREVEKMSFLKEGRKYIFGAVMTFSRKLETDLPVRSSFQLTTEELLPINTISEIEKALQKGGIQHYPETTQGGSLLDFVPTGGQLQAAESAKADFEKVGINLLLTRNNEQAVYTSAWGTGKLRSLSKNEFESQSANLSKDSILLIDGEVNDVPQVAGIISTVPLTPASHLVFLAQMYGIPLVFVPALNKHKQPSERVAEFKLLEGQWVYMATEQATGRFELVGNLNEKDARNLLSLKPKLKLNIDAYQDNGEAPVIKPVADLDWGNIKNYGAKSVQMGVILNTLDSIYRHEMAVGIPIGFYKRHLSKIKDQVHTQLNSLSGNASFLDVTKVSKNIQSLILNEKLNPEDLQYIYDSLKFYFKNLAAVIAGEKVKLKLRSSSNVEDGEQFNGAGLYDSKGLCFFNCKESKTEDEIKAKLATVVKYVWASFYNPNAFWARRQFAVSIDDELQKVGMGINVNPSVKNEIVNGVVSARIVNGDEFEVSIVESKDGDEDNSDQNKKQITHGGGDYGITKVNARIKEINSPWNPTLVRLPQLMKREHYLELHQQMYKLYQAYQTQFPKQKNMVIEGEFKLKTHTSSILLKQIRRVPYTPEIVLPQNAKYLLLGGTYKFKASHTVDSGVGMADFAKPDQVEIQIPTLLSKDVAANKLVATKITVNKLDKKSNQMVSETCDGVKAKVKFSGEGTSKKISELTFACKAPQLGAISLVFSYNFEGSDSKIRLLNSPLMGARVIVPASYEAKFLPSAATEASFELLASNPESSILHSPYCLSSHYLEGEAETECSTNLPKALTENTNSIDSKVFFKFQIEPFFGQYDQMISRIKRIQLFSKDKSNKWSFMATYELHEDFTFVNEALHDGFRQIFVDIENASPELYKKLQELKFNANYLWAPLNGGQGLNGGPYLLGPMKNGKENLMGLDGAIVKYKKNEAIGAEE
jgi:hypothetical protein